jgi:hypothetical protein
VKQVGLGWTVLPGVVDVLETDRVTTKQDSVVVVVEMDGSDQNATEVRNTVQIGIIFKKCLNISKEVTRSIKLDFIRYIKRHGDECFTLNLNNYLN